MEKQKNVGVINPYALTEVLLCKTIDWKSPASIKVMEDTLEKSYGELFDMKFNSPLYAGLKLNPKTNTAELLKPKEIQVRSEPDDSRESNEPISRDTVLTPDRVRTVTRKVKLRQSLSNQILSPALLNWTLYLQNTQDWTPSGSVWKDRGDFFNDVAEFNDPIQGAVGNCYFIAALAALAWA